MRDDFKIAATIAGLLAIIILFVTQGSNIGFDSDFTTDFISIVPGISVFIVGAIMIALIPSPLFILAGFSAMGVGMAIIVDELNTASVLIPQILTPNFTLNDLKIISILFFILIGAVAASLSRD